MTLEQLKKIDVQEEKQDLQKMALQQQQKEEE
jgi:hypothetical protein